MFKYVKNSMSRAVRSRIIVMTVLFLLLAFVLVYRLFTLQIVKGEEYVNEHTLAILKETTVKSTRGNIYDSDGNALAYNKLAYTITFEDVSSYDTTRETNLYLNGALYNLMKLIEANGDEIETDWGISLDNAGTYVFNYSGYTHNRWLADLYGESYISSLDEEQLNVTAADLMAMLTEKSTYYGILTDYTAEERARFDVPETYTKEELLKLTILRAKVAANNYQKYLETEIASDVSEETVAVILENQDNYPGVDVVEGSVRVYEDSVYFANLLGYIGEISSEELESLNAEGGSYSAGDIVGKTGLEQYFESELQGKKGSKTVYVDSLGAVVSEQSEIAPQSGNNVYLTLDRDYQIAAYHILEEYIAGIVYSNLVDATEFDRESSTSDNIKIPVYDVYYALFENNVINVDHLSSDDASSVEKRVYQSFLAKESTVFSTIRAELVSESPTAYQDLEDEYQAYFSYIVNDMLMDDTGILDEASIDKEDATYIAWTTEETISLREYLLYAISRGWVDVTKIPLTSEYLDSNEIFQALADYIEEYLTKDEGFSRQVYRYMIENEQLSGTDICLILFDQGIISMNEEDYNNLSSGALGAYDFIRSVIYNLQITPAQLALEPCSGSVVVTDMEGDVLACVTYPGYDGNRLANDMDDDYYYQLYSDLSYPFYNKATQEATAPGSTFKLVTSTAGMLEGVVDPNGTIIDCTGVFEDDDPSINCWIYSETYKSGSHGAETLVTAIRDSCNYFFNQVGRWLGTDSSGSYSDSAAVATLAEYASLYGLDAKTGIEVGESAPTLATSDAPRMAMGQSNMSFTTTQLARYASTLANSGSCYDLTLMTKITDSDGNVLEENEPVLHSTVNMTDSQWDTIHSGMKAVVENSSVFDDFSGIEMAGKTGTAEESRVKANHGLFIGYAPYDEPEIALAVRITNGYSSRNAASVAKDVVNYIYALKEASEIIDGQANVTGYSNTTAD